MVYQPVRGPVTPRMMLRMAFIMQWWSHHIREEGRENQDDHWLHTSSALIIQTQLKINYPALWTFVIDLKFSADQSRGWRNYRILPVLSIATYNIWLSVEGKKGKHASVNDCWSQVRIRIDASLSLTDENKSVSVEVKEGLRSGVYRVYLRRIEREPYMDARLRAFKRDTNSKDSLLNNYQECLRG